MKQAGTISSADLGGSSDYTSDDPCRLKWRKVSREVRYDASESLLSTSQTGLKMPRLYQRAASRKGIWLKFQNRSVGVTRQRKATRSRRGESLHESSFRVDNGESVWNSFTERNSNFIWQSRLNFSRSSALVTTLEKPRHHFSSNLRAYYKPHQVSKVNSL